MDRVARILEQDKGIIAAYGADCSIRRLDSGIPSSPSAAIISSFGLYPHFSKFEVITKSGETKRIESHWMSREKGLWVGVGGPNGSEAQFKELP